MVTTNSGTTPCWAASATFLQFATLAEDIGADVAVVGAGVTGPGIRLAGQATGEVIAGPAEAPLSKVE
jgi:hypothetical protein